MKWFETKILAPIFVDFIVNFIHENKILMFIEVQFLLTVCTDRINDNKFKYP